jgi:hypothetical protein
MYLQVCHYFDFSEDTVMLDYFRRGPAVQSTVGHSEGVARVSENQNSTSTLDEFPTLFYFYLE